METSGGSRKTGGKGKEVRVENVGSSSELSLSTASNSTLKDAPEGNTTDATRRKERKERREAKLKKREEREQEKKLQDKLSRKEARRITREEKKGPRRHMKYHQVNYHLVRMMVMMMYHIISLRTARRVRKRRRMRPVATRINTPLYPSIILLVSLTAIRSLSLMCPRASCLISMGPTLPSGST
jgi:hypothetical protein